MHQFDGVVNRQVERDAYLDQGNPELAGHVVNGVDFREVGDMYDCVQIAQSDIAHVQAFDSTHVAVDLDEIAHGQRIFDENENAGARVGHQVSRSTAQDRTDRTGAGKQRGDIHTQ